MPSEMKQSRDLIGSNDSSWRGNLLSSLFTFFIGFVNRVIRLLFVIVLLYRFQFRPCYPEVINPPQPIVVDRAWRMRVQVRSGGIMPRNWTSKKEMISLFLKDMRVWRNGKELLRVITTITI